ncbi:High-affinity glucose transporter RGT2 [Talaromyces islandicus]|uniref:High-affinity glucose transporter RGT2 n=1 Tax=Talaromyces islandicus TaxID=28573 RepID=A0A0U1MAJ7_TALIS|nr:High-affinity glucose transporter RGT2 [Talaromyces islandicus]
MLIGYDSGYLNGVLGSADFQRRYGVTDDGGYTWYLAPRTRSLFSSLLVVGTVMGASIPSMLPDKVGRRGCFLLASIFYSVGVSMQAAGPAYTAFILGRVLTGVGLGIVSVTTPGYLVEISSNDSRGRIIAAFQQVLTFGNIIACAFSLGTSELRGANSWRITVSFQLVLAFIVFLSALVAPESPLLLMRRGKPEQAAKSVQLLRNQSADSEEVAAAMREIRNWLDDQASLGNASHLECFNGTNLRRTLIGSVMGLMQMLTGITFWFGYGTTFFQAAGVQNAYLVSLVLALINSIFTAPSMYLIEKIGRRSCLFIGGAGMCIFQLATGIVHSCVPHTEASNNMLIVGAVLFIAAFAATWGPVGWTLMSEPYSARLSTQSMSVALTTYWIGTWAVGFVVPYMVDSTAGDLGANVAYFWVGTITLALTWAYFCVPELSGLSTTEVDAFFEQQVPAWRSKTWKKQLRTVNGVDISSEEKQEAIVAETNGY